MAVTDMANRAYTIPAIPARPLERNPRSGAYAIAPAVDQPHPPKASLPWAADATEAMPLEDAG